MPPRPHTFTFYSYKGGVGRSMALLNVAYTLHTMGRHVLIVDLDLEAPGVSGFLRRNDELEPHPEDQPDVLDLLTDVLPLARWQFGSPTSPEVPVLATYLRAVKSEKFAPPRNPRFQRTRLDVLCASDERDYTARLAALDIASLTADDLAETGNVLREIFLRHQFQWAREFDGAPQPTHYDYILIDSRTGFTETSGLCIGPLADRLVIFCGLNDQNINGTAEFLKVVGLKTGLRTEQWDDDDDISDTAHSARLGKKPSLLVATPVPTGDMEMKEDRFKAMKRILDVRPDLAISYHSRLSLFETVFIRNFPSEIITREYNDLTDSILSLVSDHPRQLQSKAMPAPRSDAPSADADTSILLRYAAMLDEDGAAQFASQLRYIADELSTKAAALSASEADPLFAAANEKYRAAIAIKPDDHEILTNWGNALADQAKQKRGQVADDLFAKAVHKYQVVIALKQGAEKALFNWGIALHDQARNKAGAAAEALLSESVRKYEAALRMNPNNHQALNNWGNALADQAKLSRSDEADILLAEAIQKYQASLDIKQDKFEALINWGIALTQRSKLKAGQESDAFLFEAEERYRSALALRPGNQVALNHWGLAIAGHAQRKSGSEADALFEAAGKKFEAAVNAAPENPDAYINWANTLVAHARQKMDNEAGDLLIKATLMYQYALNIKPDSFDALLNLGVALSWQAALKPGAEADILYQIAAQKYDAALKLRPDKHEALFNWGADLANQAKRKTGALRDALYTAATMRYNAALTIKPDDRAALFELAAVYSLQNNTAAALECLQKAILAGESVTKSRMASDTDFDPIRDTPEFKSFISSLPA